MASAVSRSAFDWYSQHRIDGLRSIQCDEVADDVYDDMSRDAMHFRVVKGGGKMSGGSAAASVQEDLLETDAIADAGERWFKRRFRSKEDAILFMRNWAVSISQTNFDEGDELELTDEPVFDPTLQPSPTAQAFHATSNLEHLAASSESSGDGEVDEAKIASLLEPFHNPNTLVPSSFLALENFVMELSAKAARRKAKTKSMEVQLQTLQQQMADFQSSMKDMASTIGSVKENVITEVKDLIAETNLKSMTDMRAVIEDKIARVKLRHDSNVGMMGDLCAGIVDYLIQKSGGQSSPESERLVEFMVASVQITSFLDESLQNSHVGRAICQLTQDRVSKLLGYKDYADLRKENVTHPSVRPLGRDEAGKDRGSDFHLVVLDLLKRAQLEGYFEREDLARLLDPQTASGYSLRMFLSSPSLIKRVFEHENSYIKLASERLHEPDVGYLQRFLETVEKFKLGHTGQASELQCVLQALVLSGYNSATGGPPEPITKLGPFPDDCSSDVFTTPDKLNVFEAPTSITPCEYEFPTNMRPFRTRRNTASPSQFQTQARVSPRHSPYTSQQPSPAHSPHVYSPSLQAPVYLPYPLPQVQTLSQYGQAFQPRAQAYPSYTQAHGQVDQATSLTNVAQGAQGSRLSSPIYRQTPVAVRINDPRTTRDVDIAFPSAALTSAQPPQVSPQAAASASQPSPISVSAVFASSAGSLLPSPSRSPASSSTSSGLNVLAANFIPSAPREPETISPAVVSEVYRAVPQTTQSNRSGIAELDSSGRRLSETNRVSSTQTRTNAINSPDPRDPPSAVARESRDRSSREPPAINTTRGPQAVSQNNPPTRHRDDPSSSRNSASLPESSNREPTRDHRATMEYSKRRSKG